jgi:hypothetical protein
MEPLTRPTDRNETFDDVFGKFFLLPLPNAILEVLLSPRNLDLQLIEIIPRGYQATLTIIKLIKKKPEFS